MNFCNQCGGPLGYIIPEGDNRKRYVCNQCGHIHYQNPRLVTGCVAEWEGRILLCRRAIEPRRGFWTLPAGFMENHETTAQGALRETLEEANARVELLAIYALYNLPHISQVHVMYRGRLLDPDYASGAESLEVALFAETEIPWEQLAFATVRETLTHYFADRRAGRFLVHTGDLGPADWREPQP